MLANNKFLSLSITTVLVFGFSLSAAIADDDEGGSVPKAPEDIAPRSGDDSPPPSYGPCADVSIYDFISDGSNHNRHDGMLVQWKWNKQEGERSNIGYDEERDAYYMKFGWGDNHHRTGFVCYKNPYMEEIIKNPEKMVAYHDVGRSTNVMSKDIGDHIDKMKSHISRYGTGSQHYNIFACFLCAYFRGKGCFAPETLINTSENEAKAAEDIAVGDTLWNPLTKSHSKVTKIIEGPEKLPLVEIGLGKHRLKVSTQHPVLTEDGYKQAIKLSLGDTIYDHTGEKQKVDSLRSLPVAEGQIVINFELEPKDPTGGDTHFAVISDGILSAGDISIQKELAAKDEL